MHYCISKIATQSSPNFLKIFFYKHFSDKIENYKNFHNCENI